MRFRGGSPQSTTWRKTISATNSEQQQIIQTQSAAATSVAATARRPYFSWWPASYSKKKQGDSSLPLLPQQSPPPPPPPPLSEGSSINISDHNHSDNIKTLQQPEQIIVMTSNIEGCPEGQGGYIIPQFALQEITLGLMVGQGGFSDVRDIVGIDLNEVFDTSEEETKLRKVISHGTNAKGNSKKHFVLKTLRQDLPEEEHTKGILDLAIEAEFLANLKHDNIISLRATANSDPHEERFFVILDRLGITLERKFNLWRKVAGDSTGFYFPCYGYCCSNGSMLHTLWKERLEVALQTAQALEHLHASGIVYRDLKPDNIGFDAETNLVKLFDFGLAKRLQDSEKAPDNGNPAFQGLYHLTGNTGSLRYMAPEVAKCLPYDQTVDAYSFGILFWQICSLTTPYAKYSTRMHSERVVRQGHRPKPDSSWPPSWIQLQQACWSSDRSFRPSFSSIVETIKEQLEFLDLLEDDTIVPSRASEIRAKKKKKQIKSDQLDRDTRLQKLNNSGNGSGEQQQQVQKRYDNDVV